MNIFFKDNLDSSYQSQIKNLLAACQAEAINTSRNRTIAPALEDILDADGWWFAASGSDPGADFGSVPYSDPGADLNPDLRSYLLGCMALYQTGETSWECVPFVHPDFRRKGIFSSILSAACEENEIPGDGSVYFSCSEENSLWQRVLKQIGAEHAWDEYMMERGLAEETDPKNAVCLKDAARPENNCIEDHYENFPHTYGYPVLDCCIAKKAPDSSDPDPSVWIASGWKKPFPQEPSYQELSLPEQSRQKQSLQEQSLQNQLPENQPPVTCFLAPQGDSVYLYSLEVLPEYRNKHLGTAFLSALLPQLAKKGFKTIKLQVSSENHPAMALYKKTGFHITQTLSFYEY